MKALLLEETGLASAELFMKRSARPLERALYVCEFEGGPASQVLAELARFQNPDGGFGRGLEPDLRCRESSALATKHALEILDSLPASEEKHALARRALAYFASAYRDDRQGWDIIPKEAENAPRAIWWQYGVFADNWGNPNAEIAAYFLDYRELFPYDGLDRLVRHALEYLRQDCDLKEMHEMFCYLRLAERLDDAGRSSIDARLRLFLDNCVAAGREGYGAEPLQVADSPKSRFYPVYADVIPAELDKLIGGQGEDGAWAPSWTWHRYEDEWPQAREEWKGIITLQALRTLRNYGRLRFPEVDRLTEGEE